MPALQLEPLAIRPRPVQRQPLFLKQLLEDEVAVLKDLDFDRHLVRIEDATHIGTATSQAPQHARARLDGVCRHVFAACPFHATR